MLADLDGRVKAATEPEEVVTFAPEVLAALRAEGLTDKGLAHLSVIFQQDRGFAPWTLSDEADWWRRRDGLTPVLGGLLGESAALPRRAAAAEPQQTESHDGLLMEHVAVPSEGPIDVPITVVRPQDADGRLPLVIICSSSRKTLLGDTRVGSPADLAAEGSMVVLADVRLCGDLALTPGFAVAAPALLERKPGLRPLSPLSTMPVAWYLCSQ